MQHKQQTKFKKTEIGLIPEDWEVVKLGNVCEVKSGKRLRKGRTLVKHKTEHPYIRVRDLSNRSVKVSELLFLDEETYKEISRYIITKNDVYISIVGSIGLVGLIPKEISGANLTENCARLTNITKSTKEWLSFYLNSKSGQDQIRSLTVGTTQGKLALFRIKDINIPLPKLNEQQSIAKIFSDLDSKIELNQQMNKTLGAIGQAIFKHWFIDFEFPNEEGKPYKNSGGEMIDSELGEIPKGWKVLRLNKEFDFLRGVEPGSKYYNKENKGKQFIRVGNLTGKRDEELYVDVKTEAYCSKNDILVSFDGTVGIVKIGLEGIYSSGIRKVVSKSKLYNEFFIYLLMKSDNVQQQIRSFTGDETTIKHVGKHIDNLKFAISSEIEEKILNKFNQITSPIFDKLLKNLDEIQVLSQIRDSLLPKLMSGKIRVPVKNGSK